MVYKHHTNLKDMLLADLHLKVMHGMFCSVTKPKKCNCRDNSKVNGQYMFGGECQTGNLIYKATVFLDGKHYLGKTQNDPKTRFLNTSQMWANFG